MIRAEYRVVDNTSYPGEWYVELHVLTDEHAGFTTYAHGPNEFHVYPERPDELRALGETIVRAADELQAKQTRVPQPEEACA